MNKYRIYFTGVESISVEVEADSLEEAQEAAWEEVPRGVCAQCSGYGASWSRDAAEDLEMDEATYSVDGQLVEIPKPNPEVAA